MISLVYFRLMRFRNALFDQKVLKSRKLPIKVLSIGNISVGGSGKTAVVMEILKEIPSLSVLTRGYGSKVLTKKQYPCFVESPVGRNQQESFIDAQTFGDEPALIKNKFKDTPVVIDPDRFRGGLFALRTFPELKGFVLDDGFQHRYLHRDLDVVLISLDDFSLKNIKALPYGRYREDLEALKRADCLLLTKWENVESQTLEKWIMVLKTYCLKVYKVNSVISRIANEHNQDIQSDRVIVFSGLGEPAFFEKEIRRYFPKLQIIEHVKFKDHYQYQGKDINSLLDRAQKLNATLICSEKDFVKLKSMLTPENLTQFYYTRHGVSLDSHFKMEIKNLFGHNKD